MPGAGAWLASRARLAAVDGVPIPDAFPIERHVANVAVILRSHHRSPEKARLLRASCGRVYPPEYSPNLLLQGERTDFFAVGGGLINMPRASGEVTINRSLDD